MHGTTNDSGAREAKRLGAYDTPPVIAEFMARWAVRGYQDPKVLDPTCGRGGLLSAVARHIESAGGHDRALLLGIDVDPAAVGASETALARHSVAHDLIRGDFLDLSPSDMAVPMVDAIVGNPPYVRFHLHRGAGRARAQAAALRQGVNLGGLASSWASVLVHASAFLTPNGRMAMVLPVELLTVTYAEPVRAWLQRRFAAVRLVFFERQPFAADENVLLVLAEGHGGCDAFSIYYVHEAVDLAGVQPFTETTVRAQSSQKWSDLILTRTDRGLLQEVGTSGFVTLGTVADLRLGTVTGANSFFTMSDTDRHARGLTPGRDVIRLFPPGTRGFRGLRFGEREWTAMLERGQRAWLFEPSRGSPPSEAAQRYIDAGAAAGAALSFKARTRPVWWRLTPQEAPDAFLTYMSHHHPRIVLNQASASFLNSAHVLRLRPGMESLAADLPYACLNSFTMVSAELLGRSYGGGVLKLEPTEARRMLVPSPEAIEKCGDRLKGARPQIDRRLDQGDWQGAMTLVDAIVLEDGLAWNPQVVERVAAIRTQLHDGRMHSRAEKRVSERADC